MKYSYHCLRRLTAAAALAAALLAGGCRRDDGDIMPLPVDAPIAFGAAVYEGSAVQTRALVLNDISRNPYDIDFFVQLDYTDSKTGAPPEHSIKRYTVASSYESRLDALITGNRLNWKDATSDHTFYAWTLPWIEAEKEKSKYADEVEGESCWKMYYDENGKPKIKVTFHNSGDGADFNTYKNNAILETFIGAQIGPVNYRAQGTYVPLTFFHLVSQIRLGKLTVIRSDGSRHEDLKANLTFFGMPTEAVFDPHPYEYIPNPHPAEWINDPENWNQAGSWSQRFHHPVVIGPEKGYEEDSEITFFIPESAEAGRPDDRFYVCPEVDFAQLMYKVTITTKDAPEEGIEYYGDFRSVEFVRTNRDPYDKGKEDDTVLHAGEMMTLDLTLRPGVGPGATITIQDWNDAQPTQSEHYAHPGIFTDHAAQELADAKAEDMKDLFDLYGETENGEKVFKIYENVTIEGSKFPVSEGYVVDGKGHTITMKSSPVTVGAMRDVYLTDGQNTVWIDAKGTVWTFNSSTKKFEKTAYSISGKNSSTIHLGTGAVS